MISLTEEQKQIFENIKSKLENTKVSGDKGEIYNFEAGYILDILKIYEVELETYKKIAELFGKSLINISGEKTSLEELIDWAKREVENENRN